MIKAHLVVVNDGVQPMCDGQDGAVLELGPHGLLDDSVSLDVHIGGGLIKHLRHTYMTTVRCDW